MIPSIGKKYLITCDSWFYGPDGESYRAVFGTVHAVNSAKDTLGIETNGRSTNWYVMIGNMILAGCQIHYCIETDDVSFNGPTCENDHEGVIIPNQKLPTTRIYDADQ